LLLFRLVEKALKLIRQLADFLLKSILGFPKLGEKTIGAPGRPSG